MNYPRSQWLATLVLALSTLSLAVVTQQMPVYFDLGQRLTEDFQGTYEFKHKHLEFTRRDGVAYTAASSGDQSPRQDEIVARDGYVYWILGGSGEQWIAFKVALRRGDEWHHKLRGWNQLYRVVATNETVTVPAGVFQHCARIEVSWSANEPDMKGRQEVVYYLAPHLGIIKREVQSNGQKWHEEVLTGYDRR